MNSKKLAAFLLLFGMAGAASVLAGEKPADRFHHDALDQCASCHKDADSAKFKKAMVTGCAECHAANKARAIRVGESGFADAEHKAAASSQGAAKGPGVDMPMLYDDTKVGKEPNPMVKIPEGEFTMGNDNRLPDEGPERKVSLKSYWIDKYEVTNLQYKQFIDATNRKSPDHFRGRTFPKGKADHPVVYVTWHDANAYCGWAGKRLPSDAEWEKAARGTDGRWFPWGGDFDINKVNSPVRWQNLELEADTTPVGSFPDGASPYGVLDLSGNVWEWVDSWYTQYPGNKTPSENYGQLYKQLKGGSWFDCSYYQCGISAPAFNRSYFNQTVKNSSFGFRCAKDDK